MAFELGEIVKSNAGRDKEHHYLVAKVIDNKYIEVIDGKIRKISNPKKKNKISINHNVYDVDFEVDVKINKKPNPTHNGKRGETKNKDRKSKPLSEYYNGAEDDLCVVKWNHGKDVPQLNSNRPEIISFAENGEGEIDRFSEVYEEISRIGREVYMNKPFYDKYNMSYNGNPTFQNDYQDGKGFRFNERVCDFLNYSPDVKKLRQAHDKYMEQINSKGSRAEKKASGKKPKALNTKSKKSVSNTRGKSEALEVENTSSKTSSTHSSIDKGTKAFGKGTRKF